MKIFSTACAGLLGLLLSASCVADVLPPAYGQALERLRNTQVWDQEDQYCAGKRPQEHCTVAGTPFEGGGAGVCQRDVPRNGAEILLSCERRPAPQIERSLPNGPYAAEPSTCEAVAKGQLSPQALNAANISCQSVARVHDRFCQGQAVGASCEAEASVDAKLSRQTGVCQEVTQESRYYQYGYRIATRQALLCQPIKPTPARQYKPVSGFRKMFM